MTTLAKTPVSTVATHTYASGGTYTDTETRLEWSGNCVSVTVSILPGLVYWTCPPAAVIRKWVDELLEGQPLKRDGQRIELGSSLKNWYYRYYLKSAI